MWGELSEARASPLSNPGKSLREGPAAARDGDGLGAGTGAALGKLPFAGRKAGVEPVGQAGLEGEIGFFQLDEAGHAGAPVLAVLLARLFQRVRFAEHIGQIKQLLACGGVPVLGRGRR